MDYIHITILVVGLLALVEATWALLAPESLKNLLNEYIRDDRGAFATIGFLFVGLGLVCWILATAGQPRPNGILTAIGIYFVGIGALGFKPEVAEKVLNFWLLRRSPLGIRLNYLVVLAIALTLIWAGINGPDTAPK